MSMSNPLIDDRDRVLELPLGYRFAPTDQELLDYYLTKKMSHESVDDPIIKNIDAEEFYSRPPEDIVDCGIRNPLRRDDEWFLFIHRHGNVRGGDKGRCRVVGDRIGSWKSDRGGPDPIYDSDGKVIAVKTKFRYHDGHKTTKWWMEEYKLLRNSNGNNEGDDDDDDDDEEEWFVGRITKGKKALQRQYYE